MKASRKIAICGVLIALSMALSFAESLVPVFFAVPGMKLGLSNLVVMVAIYTVGLRYAFGINMIRILLAAATFGNAFALMYSAAGGVLSFVVMALLFKTGKFSPVGVSAAGGVFHNVGQVIVAFFVLESGYVMYYLPFLVVSGTVSGILIGILGGVMVRRLSKIDTGIK